MRICGQCSQPNEEQARFCSRCGGILDQDGDPSDPLIGRVVAGRFRIVRVIGEGGMGRVYLAEQRMGTAIRAVALKVLTTSVYDSLSVARFHRECETVIQLTHPNTIRFYDFGKLDIQLADGSVDRRLFIAMEYVDGRSLAGAIAAGPMPVAVVDRLVRQIGGALSEAHRRGIVHRDLKPDNVLLAHDEVDGEIPKVCDFGIAKTHTQADAEITAQGTIIGTPAYMSPEQISGLPVDERSDVYALALMTYEMLTGHRPFAAHTPLEWATAHMTLEPRSFDAFPATRDLPQPRRDAILRALAKDAAKRTAKVRTFVDELTGDTRSGPSEAPPRLPVSPLDPTAHATPLSHSGSRSTRTTSALLPTLAGLAGLGLCAISGGMLYFAYGGVGQGVTATSAGDAGIAPAEADAPAARPDEWLSILQYEDRADDAALALGPPDGRCALIAARGTITLELTPGVRVATDGTEAPDLEVVIDPARSGPYRVDVGVERRQFTTIAEGLIHSTPLDVDQYEIRRFRYVRIKNREQRGTVCVDAVRAFRHE
jgi:serine/threonine protein kinase